MNERHGAERRSFRRFRVGIPAELYGRDCVRQPCTLIDISPSGALVACDPIADDKTVTLWLSGFGELRIARLRAKGGLERLLFREPETRINQFRRFLARLVEAGAASLTSQRRMGGQSLGDFKNREPHCTFDEAILKWVDKALAIAACETRRIDNASGNVVEFPARRRHTTEYPDTVA